MNIIKNIKDSYKHIPYTFKHYLAFMKVQKQLLGYYKYKFHDWDKLFTFIFMPYLGDRRINQMHQLHNAHHPTYTVGVDRIKQLKSPSCIEFEEAIIDWECARFTKKDKPLNAYQTLIKYYPEYINEFKPYFIKLNLWEE